MKRFVVLAVLAGLLCAAPSAGAQSAPVSFSTTYQGFNQVNACNSTQSIPGYEPADTSVGHPLFIYLHGWNGEGYSEWKAPALEAANQGFVAAAPRWSSFWALSSQAQQNSHARCIFGSSAQNPKSAIQALCGGSVPGVDCSKGIVVSGLSLGANLAAISQNYEPRVRAAYLLGFFSAQTNLLPVADGGTRQLPSDRMRVTIGREDAPTSYDAMNRLLQRSCAFGNFNCFAPDGSGYYVVQDNQVLDRHADHCFHFYYGGCLGIQAPFDPGWRAGATNPWSLTPAIAWLKSFVSS